MLAIISNLKFCYKFFQEENFEKLTDSEFARFEESLESTEQMIEGHKKELVFHMLTNQRASTREALEQSLEALDHFSALLGQFWAQEVGQDFQAQLESASKYWV